MEFKCFTVGDDSGFSAGQTLFKAEFLKNCLVSHIIVNNENENQQNPNPDFIHNYVDGYVDRKPNVWSTGDKLLVYFKKCNCCD